MSTTTIYGNPITTPMKQNVINAQPVNAIFGVKFPLYENNGIHKGIFNKTKGISLLRSEVLQFVQTERGERVMLPNFGLSLKRFLFEPLTEDLTEEIYEEVYMGMTRYLPHVEVRALRVLNSENIQGSGLPGLIIHLTVSHRSTNEISSVSINV